MRFVTRVTALTCLFAAMAAACSGSAPVKFTAQTTTLDDGTLTMTTARPQVTAVSQAAAEFDLAHSDLGGAGWAQLQVEFGYVTVKPSAMKAFNPGDAVPGAPSHQLSWVLFYEPGKSNCPNAGPSQPAPSFAVAHPSGKQAMIVDATTGAALGYEGAGAGNCTSALRPSVTKAGGDVSVPWKDSGADYVIATYPACVTPGEGTPGESDASGTTFAVVGFRFYEPCHAKPTTAQVPVNFPRPWKHSPVGPVATGTSG